MTMEIIIPGLVQFLRLGREAAPLKILLGKPHTSERWNILKNKDYNKSK